MKSYIYVGEFEINSIPINTYDEQAISLQLADRYEKML